MILVYIFAIVFAFWYFCVVKRPKGMAPGPMLRFPLFGQLPLIVFDQMGAYKKMRKRYV